MKLEVGSAHCCSQHPLFLVLIEPSCLMAMWILDLNMNFRESKMLVSQREFLLVERLFEMVDEMY